MNAAVEFTVPSEAKRALDRQGESDEPSPWPSSGRSVATTVVAVLLVFYTLFFAASLLVPIAAAVLLSMLLAPVVQLSRDCVSASARVCDLVLRRILAWGDDRAAGPAKTWIERTAQSLQKLEQKFRATTKPIEDIKKSTGELQEATQPPASPAVQEVRVAGPALGDVLLSATPRAVASILSTTILVYFLLVAGDVFLRKLVLVIPTFRDKKRAVDITRQIETDISFYCSTHVGECRLGRCDGYRDGPPGHPESAPVGRIGRRTQFRAVRRSNHQHDYACDGRTADLRQRAAGVGCARHLGWSRGVFRRGGHALCAGARAAPQSGCDLHRHNVVGLALGHRRSAPGGAVASELQDHLRAGRAPESDC